MNDDIGFHAIQIAAMPFPQVALFDIKSTADQGAAVAKNTIKVRGTRGKVRSHDKAPTQTGAESEVPADLSFDQWLREKLEALYGSVIDEPIPDELLKVLASFQQKEKD